MTMNAGFNANIFEQGFDVLPSVVSVDGNSDVTGIRINAQNYDRLYYLLAKPAGTAGDDLSIEMLQHDAASSGNSKALNFSRIFHKIGTLSSVGQYTEVELTTPTNDLDLSSVNGADLGADDKAALILVEVIPEQMDGANGYTFVSVNHEGDDVSNSVIITGLWMATGNRYSNRVPLSALS